MLFPGHNSDFLGFDIGKECESEKSKYIYEYKQKRHVFPFFFFTWLTHRENVKFCIGKVSNPVELS